jgi:hypothetical protein
MLEEILDIEGNDIEDTSVVDQPIVSIEFYESGSDYQTFDTRLNYDFE